MTAAGLSCSTRNFTAVDQIANDPAYVAGAVDIASRTDLPQRWKRTHILELAKNHVSYLILTISQPPLLNPPFDNPWRNGICLLTYPPHSTLPLSSPELDELLRFFNML